jgi:hypothetical protein
VPEDPERVDRLDLALPYRASEHVRDACGAEISLGWRGHAPMLRDATAMLNLVSDLRRGTSTSLSEGAEKARKGPRDRLSPFGVRRYQLATPQFCRTLFDGETRTRTGDTTIFRQLYGTLEHSRNRLQTSEFLNAGLRCDVSRK